MCLYMRERERVSDQVRMKRNETGHKLSAIRMLSAGYSLTMTALNTMSENLRMV